MKEKLEIENWFNDLNKLIQDSFICFKNLKQFYDLVGENKVLHQDFFVFFIYQQWFMISIQLSKVFECTKNQKRNIKTLFNNIIKGDFDSEINQLMNKSDRGFPCFNTLDEVKEGFKGYRKEIKKYQKNIDKIIKVRNEVYAHTDFERTNKFPSLAELDLILNFSSEMYNLTINRIYGKNIDFSKGIITLTLNDVVRLINK